jgi:putative aldouronate transport system permease protein
MMIKRPNRLPKNSLSPALLIINCVLLFIVFVIMFVPMLYVLALSFSTNLGSMSSGIRLWPDKFTVIGYIEVWNRVQLWRPFFNSVFVTTVGILIEIFLSAMSAYVLIQKELPFKKMMTSIILITMMIPGNLTLISTYYLNKQIGLLNTYTGLILNGLISGFSILVIRGYFLSVPDSLAESARIDSAGEVTVFMRIYLPLSIPGIVTVAFLEFVDKWNSLMIPVSITTDQNKFTLPVILRSLVFNDSGESGMNYITPNVIMAAIVISVVPLIAFYVFSQRFLKTGMNLGAVKG